MNAEFLSGGVEMVWLARLVQFPLVVVIVVALWVFGKIEMFLISRGEG
jgi:hypothetical protein